MDAETKKLYETAIKGHDILFTADTVFPFTLFPDTINLDREKLTIVHRSFFRVAKITSVRVHDILGSEVDVGPFFGSVHVSSRYFVNDPQKQSVNFLWRSQAIKAHRLIQGFIIAAQKGIDTMKPPLDELIVLLDDLGKGASD